MCALQLLLVAQEVVLRIAQVLDPEAHFDTVARCGLRCLLCRHWRAHVLIQSLQIARAEGLVYATLFSRFRRVGLAVKRSLTFILNWMQL